MPELKWTAPAQIRPDHPYVIFASRLPAEGVSKVPAFMRHTRRITRQLQEAEGLIAYSLRADILSHTFWTLSAWESEAALHAFVHTEPHASTMRELAAHTKQPGFTSWKTTAPLPLPAWEEVSSRLATTASAA